MSTWKLPTSDPGVASVLGSIREAIVTVTGSSLVGPYLFGSLATRVIRRALGWCQRQHDPASCA
jgi:hypothetical protein